LSNGWGEPSGGKNILQDLYRDQEAYTQQQVNTINGIGMAVKKSKKGMRKK